MCPAPFVYVGSSCLYLETDPDKKMNWTDARAACIAHRGDLAILNTEEKHRDAEEIVKSYGMGLNSGTTSNFLPNTHNLDQLFLNKSWSNASHLI